MNKIDNLNSAQLELFVAITEQGSFSEAAQALGLTQSAVSHGLARLETELGLLLVERGRRGVTLTKAGEEILPHARDVVARLNVIRQISTASEGAVRGKMRIGITYPLPSRLLIESIAAFRVTHPEVEIILVDDTGSESKNWVADGLVDVGIVIHPAPGAESRLLLQDEIYAVMNTEHTLSAQQSVSPEELFREPLIVPRLGRELVIEALRSRGGTSGRPQVRHLVSDIGTIWEMVSTGMGIALVSKAVFDSASGRDESLIALPLVPPIPLPLGLAVRSWDAASPVTKHFVESVLDR